MVGFGCGGDDEQDFQGSSPTPTVTHSSDSVVVEGEEAAAVAEEEEEVDRETCDLQLPQDRVLAAKLRPRLRWTPELHACFVDAVNQLGGLHKATPKKIQEAMGVQGITLFHLKSHLQKYRLGRHAVKEWREGTQTFSQDSEEGRSTGSTSSPSPKLSRKKHSYKLVKEALDEERDSMQVEVGRRLHIRQDAERRFMNFAMENACKKLADQFIGAAAAAAILNGIAGVGTLELYPAYQMTEGTGMQPSLEGHPTSHGHSENSSVEDFHTRAEDDEKTEESLDNDPAEAYLINPDPDME
ncbi:protein PHR1-LIKE 3-like [Malus sylvestris]|uniref:protein PHR1-LIKE 3-like n=1 Tax=Malus sylvestris TaxID=3752 RepID=UPI0021ACF168|nr:protein PHR1-LIKE 3-like [Malus sylvestris]